MMKMYKVNDGLYWYNEDEQPEGAIEVNREEKQAPVVKAVEPQNKARKASKNK